MAAIKLRGVIKKIGTTLKLEQDASARLVLVLTLEVDGVKAPQVERLVDCQRDGEVAVEIEEIQVRVKGT